jgi:hypothetical protein
MARQETTKVKARPHSSSLMSCLNKYAEQILDEAYSVLMEVSV